MTIVFTLEGNIGSGKSTLLRKVEHLLQLQNKHNHVVILQEPVYEWSAPRELLGGESMLSKFYQDPVKNAFAFQMFVLASRIEQAVCASSSDSHTLILTERCLKSDDVLFARPLFERGGMTAPEMVAYETWKNNMLNLLVKQGVAAAEHPFGIIYLRTSPEVCLRRIGARSRNGEADINIEYLSALHDAHERWIMNETESRVKILDGDVDGLDALDDHARAIVDFMMKQSTIFL